MFVIKSIYSYFKSGVNVDDNELSLEEACGVLRYNKNDFNVLHKESPSNFSDYESKVKKGFITKVDNETCTIDDLYMFETDNKDIFEGAEISFRVFISGGKVKIFDVKLVDDWNAVEETNSFWCNRTIMCKVESRNGRNLLLSPGAINVDLNIISTEFVPIVGDWVELDVKSEVDENITDLSGKILEINKLLPVRPHIKAGSVTTYNAIEKQGTVNLNIFFDKNSLSCGYVPAIRDKVIVEVIESDQQKCSWRALKVIPECMKRMKEDMVKDDNTQPEFMANHSDLTITDNICHNFSKLNDSLNFYIVIFNNADENYKLLKAEFLKQPCQCSVTSKSIDLIVKSKCSIEIHCKCISRNIGISKEFLLLTFEGFKIGRWIQVDVTPQNVPSSNYKSRYKSKTYTERNERQVVRGQRKNAPPRFIANNISDYKIPSRLLDVIKRCQTENDLIGELKVFKPCLFSDLSYMNYEDRFHTLLYLNEIKIITEMSSYDQEKACFIANDEYLMLEIENLAERRPSIIVGDRIIARDPINSKCDFEAFVHKVGSKHVYLKFSQLFHESYRGEDYSIRVISGRTQYKRMHHAVYLAARHLGRDLLFTSQVVNKEPQVDYQDDNHVEKKKLSPRDIIKNIEEFNNKSEVEKDQYKASIISNKVMQSQEKSKTDNRNLKWYNQSLNYYQKKAVKNVLLGAARPLPYIIFGPPGTGKTVTLVEIILQIVRFLPQSRLLVAAPSNSAADLLALKLIDSGVLKPGDLVRLVSHNYVESDSIPPKLVPYSVTGNIAREGTQSENFVSEKGLITGCSSSVLGRHRITVSTCNSCGVLHSMDFPKGHFSHILVDEAGQAAEPEVMIPLSFLDTYTGQIILAGDPMQLGPVVNCKIANQCGLSESYLERLINRFPYLRDPEGFPETGGYDPRLVTKLLYNYRSLDILLKLTSFLFYHDELLPTISNKTSSEIFLLNKLKDILPSTKSSETPCIVFHGVKGENYQTPDSPSWFNPHEAAQVFYYINQFYGSGLSSKDIGIITPYIKQVKEIRSLLIEAEFDIPKIGTVEEFQGQEFNVVILSTVRSNQQYITSDLQHSLGFVSSPRRLNVAISRAKCLLIIVGNPNLLWQDTYWRTVIKYCFEKGSYTGCELIDSS